jgi:hypothetical protein
MFSLGENSADSPPLWGNFCSKLRAPHRGRPSVRSSMRLAIKQRRAEIGVAVRVVAASHIFLQAAHTAIAVVKSKLTATKHRTEQNDR